MQQRWMRIIESGSDRSVGAALVRLADRAARMHREELAAGMDESGHDGASVEPGAPVNGPHRVNREPER